MPELTAQVATKPEATHEALCHRCGKCCYRKVIIGHTVHITPFPCEFLDVKTNLCTVYQRRFELNRHCLTVATGLKHLAFPRSCGYVAALAPKGYRPAREDRDWGEEWEDFEAWADDLEVSAEVRALVRGRGPLAPPLYVETNARLAMPRAAEPRAVRAECAR
jgi:uncharacterized protein